MILDSCSLIDLMNGDEAALARLDELTEEARPLAMSTLTVTEVGSGLRGEREIRAFDALVDRMTVVPYEYHHARRAARIQRRLFDEGAPIGAVDVMIAATAVERSEPILTRNVSEFGRIEAARVSPY